MSAIVPVTPVAAAEAPTDIGWNALGPTIAMTVLASTVVTLRWYTRVLIVRCVGLDDCAILLSLILAFVMCGIVAAEVETGIGDHGWRDNLSLLPAIAKLVLSNNCIYTLIINITKLSILAQYLRVFNGRIVRSITHCLIFLLLPATCWATFGGVFLCRPVAKYWHPEIAGHCMNVKSYWVSAAAVNIVLDLCVLVLPMPAIASLHLPRKQKRGLVLVFALGFFVCIVSIARLVVVHEAAERLDWTCSGIDAIIWSAVEANTGIICASLLALKPLVVKLFPRLMEDSEIPTHSMRLPAIKDEASSPTDSDTAFFGAGGHGSCRTFVRDLRMRRRRLRLPARPAMARLADEKPVPREMAEALWTRSPLSRVE
ncbi:hypothetical protein LTR66_007017 [Elasticomyces elasticus]|nr:hypothetical protein LTR66_007017 [Elasticomyces elasticus]KAK5010980.1 hypothetical protein LTR28_006530 [Elasticomyces elasticus]